MTVVRIFRDRDSSMSLRDRRSGPHHNQATGSTTAGVGRGIEGTKPREPDDAPNAPLGPPILARVLPGVVAVTSPIFGVNTESIP